MKSLSHSLAILLLIFFSPFKINSKIDGIGKVKNKINQRADQKVDNGIDKGLDKSEDEIKNNNKKDKENQETPSDKENSNTSNTNKSTATTKDEESTLVAYGKYDFVPGTHIIFEDEVTREQLGEFPSKWDLASGKIEIASVDGHQVIAFLQGNLEVNYSSIFPLWKDKSDYLPEVFTLEFDHYVPSGGFTQMLIGLRNKDAGAEYDENDLFDGWIMTGSSGNIGNAMGNFNGEYTNTWHHIALSYNKPQGRVCEVVISNFHNGKKNH